MERIIYYLFIKLYSSRTQGLRSLSKYWYKKHMYANKKCFHVFKYEKNRHTINAHK